MKESGFFSLDDQDERNKEVKESGWRSLYFLLNFSKEHKWKLLFGMLLLLTYSVTTMFSGFYMGKLVGEGLAKKDWDLTKKFSLFVMFFEISSLLLNYFGRKVITTQSSYIIYNMREALFSKLSKLPMSFLDRWPDGRIVTRLTHDVEGVETFFTGSLGRILNACFMALASIVAMSSSDISLSLIIIASMIPALMTVILTRTKVTKLTKAMSKLSSQINSKLSEFIDGLYVIRAYGLENWSQKIFSNNVDLHVDKTLEANFFYGWSRPLVSFLCGLPLILLVWFGGNRVLEGTMSLAIFVAFLRYSERFFMPVMMLFREIHVIMQAFSNASRVANFLEFKTEKTVFSNNQDLKQFNIDGSLSFKNVWMSYDANSVEPNWSLKDISFEINKGEKIGILGTTGSGKTTLISVLSRLYDYQKGEIRIDSHSLKDWDVDDLRSQIGLVSQDVVLFKGTLRDNLTVNSAITNEEILELSKFTGLSLVMENNNLTLDTLVKDGGSNFSAGEKQIISLTRICLLNPQILILDEATANIDPFYEKILHDGIEYLMKGKTSLIIAHRLDTIKECDRLLVFENGSLVEFDTPETLSGNRGHYYRLLQTGIKQEDKSDF